MAVVITNITILKPAPSPVLHPLLNAEVPLTIFDRAAFDLHVPTMYAFRPPMPSNAALVRGLAAVLRHFPHLCGRMVSAPDRRPFFLLNNGGVRLIETEVAAALAEKLPLERSDELSSLHPPVSGVEELFQVQLNRYSCGGLVIGATSHHRVADGHSMSGFLVAWTATVRALHTVGDDQPPFSLPYLDRAAVLVPRDPPHCEFNHREVEFKQDAVSSPAAVPPKSCTVENLVVHFSAKFVAKLKANVTNSGSGGGDRRCSTFECLLAHLWKKTAATRDLEHDERTRVRVAVNGRARMSPAVPPEYFGNLVLWAYPNLTAGELTRESHAYAVQTIHDAVVRIDDGYFQSFVDFGELCDGGEAAAGLVATAPETGNSLCPDLEVDSWLRFNFHDLDFGTGSPCAFLPPQLPVEGLMIFVPSCKEKGGVDVFLALSRDHVDHFRRICHSLD